MILIAIATLIFSYKSFGIKTTHHKFLPKDEVEQITEALSLANFYENLSEKKVLGAGSYGFVLDMEHKDSSLGKSHHIDFSKSHFAIKISNQVKIESLHPITEIEELKNYDNRKTIPRINNDFLSFLHYKKVPYVLIPLIDAYVLIEKEKRGVLKNIWALEYASEGDMSNLINIEHMIIGNFEITFGFVYDFLFKLSYSLSKINSMGIIHGDLKPQNIFVRTCTLKSLINYCPVIGDWDLGFYHKENPKIKIKDKSKNKLKYTHTYRPAEMHFLLAGDEKENDYELINYEYNGKEDVYALGVTMLMFLNKRKVELDQIKNNKQLYDLFNDMLWPVTVDVIYPKLKYGYMEAAVFINAVHFKVSEVNKLRMSMNNAINKIMGIINKDSSSLNRYNYIPNMGNIYYTYKKLIESPLIKNPLIDNILLEEVLKYDEEFKNMNISYLMSKNRIEMETVFTRMGIILKSNYNLDTNKLINDMEKEWQKHYINLYHQSKAINEITSRKIIHISKNFSELDHKQKLQFCVNVNKDEFSKNNYISLITQYPYHNYLSVFCYKWRNEGQIKLDKHKTDNIISQNTHLYLHKDNPQNKVELAANSFKLPTEKYHANSNQYNSHNQNNIKVKI